MNDKQKSTSLELFNAAQAICFELESREGVTDEDLDAAIAEFLDGSEDKMDRHRYAIQMFQSQSKMYRAEVQRLQGRARMLEGIVDRIKQHARLVMEARVEMLGEKDGRKLETEHGIVYLQKRDKLVIDDDDAFCDLNRTKAFITYHPKIDKRAVLAALKEDDTAVQLARVEKSVSVVFK